MISAPRGRRRLWPRLVLLAVVLVAAQQGVNRYVQWSVVQAGQKTIGAKIDVGASRVSLANGRVSLRNVCVANPHAPLQNLVEAADCESSLDAEALLYRRVVVRQGHVHGLRFGTSRATSGALNDTPADDPLPWPNGLDEKSAAVAQQWLQQLEERFQQDLADSLRSVRLTDQLLAHWPEEYAALARRVREFHGRTVEFQNQIEEAQANPLRHVGFLESVPDQIAALRRQYEELHREIDALPGLADVDRRAIVAARRHDEQLLYDRLQFDPVDADVLSAYLMQRQLAGPLGDLIGWLRWMRRIVPADGGPAESAPARGEDVLFAGCARVPRFLIQSLELQGSAEFGSQSLAFTGTLADYASEPALHDKPLVLRLGSKSSLPLGVVATIDRTGPVARDQIALNCRGLVLPAIVLGDSAKLRLSLAPTSASLVVRILIEGEELSGDIQLIQDRAQIAAQLDGRLDRPALVDSLDQSLRSVDAVTTNVSLRGTLKDPQWHVTSSLGPTLAQAIGDAFRQATRHHAAEVVARSQRDVDEQLAGLDRQITRQQQTLQPELAKSTDLLEAIARRQQQQERLSFGRLGSSPPAGSLLR